MIKKRLVRAALLVCASAAALGMLVGASSATAKKPKTKTVTKTATVTQCANTSVAIPDNESSDGYVAVGAPVNFTVPKIKGKPQDGVVTAVNSLGVRITHTFAGDIGLFLVSPSGKAINLTIGDGGARDGYGTGPASCGGTLFQFADTGADSIVDVPGSSEEPLTGTFRPFQPLSLLAGGAARGNWTLVAFDDSSGDVGSINAVSVNLTYTYLTAVKKPKKKK